MKRRSQAGIVIALSICLLQFGLWGCAQKDQAEVAGEAMGEMVDRVDGGEEQEAKVATTAIGKKWAKLMEGFDPPASYEVKTVSAAGEESMSMLYKFSGREPVKIKMINPGGWILVDMENEVTYAFDKEDNRAMKMPLGGLGDGQTKAPSDYLDPEAEILASDTVDGVKCWVTRSLVGPLKSKVWVGAKDGLPRQMETDKGITKFVYSRINRVADSEFDLPAGVQVMDMKQMMRRD